MEIKLWMLLLGIPYLIWTLCSIYIIITQYKNINKRINGKYDGSEITPYTNSWIHFTVITLLICVIILILMNLTTTIINI